MHFPAYGTLPFKNEVPHPDRVMLPAKKTFAHPINNGA